MAAERLAAGFALASDEPLAGGQSLGGVEPLASSDLLDALCTGVVLLDADLRLQYANVGAQDLLTLGLAQAYGRPLLELLADPEPLARLIARAIERGEAVAGHEIALAPAIAPAAAGPAVVDVTVTPLPGPFAGSRLLLELADARTRQRLSRESEMRSRLDGRRLMTRQLAHEIKNPLGGLRGAAQLLERELSRLAGAALTEYTQVIINEADRLRDLVDRMLGPSRPPQKSLVNVHELCEHVYHLLSSEAGPGVAIERDYDPSLPSGEFDRHEIIQALLNVARNALQALPPQGGRVILRSRALPNHSIGAVRHRLVVALQVEDDGTGVPPSLAGSLFYPLVTGRANGSGLGLAVAQDLVARHHGLIEFDSRPGRTVFSLLLPLELETREPTA